MDRTRIGEIIRARRAALKLTLRAAADLSGGTVKHSTWGQIETGDMNATIDMLSAIAVTLKCRWEHRMVPESTELQNRTELLDRFTAIVDRLTDRDARLLMSQIAEYEREFGITRDRV